MIDYPIRSPDGVFVAVGPGKRPHYNPREGDYDCSICGEPYSLFGIKESLRIDGDGDITPGQAVRFMRGEGCPSCDFGKKENFMFHPDRTKVI